MELKIHTKLEFLPPKTLPERSSNNSEKNIQRDFFASSFLHTCCLLALKCYSPKKIDIFLNSIFDAKFCLQFFVGRIQYIISKKWFDSDLILIWSKCAHFDLRFIFSILTIESGFFWIRCFLLLFTQSILKLEEEGQVKNPIEL